MAIDYRSLEKDRRWLWRGKGIPGEGNRMRDQHQQTPIYEQVPTMPAGNTGERNWSSYLQICVLLYFLKYVVLFSFFHFRKRHGYWKMFLYYEKNSGASLIINGVDIASEFGKRGNGDCELMGTHFIWKETPPHASRLVVINVASLWDFSRNARIWILWNV